MMVGASIAESIGNGVIIYAMNGTHCLTVQIVDMARRLLGFLKKDKQPHKHILILPPTSPGSLGDEAIITALVSQVRCLGDAPCSIAVIDFNRKNSWSNVVGVDRVFNLKGFFGRKPRWGVVRFLFYALWADVLYCLGTDNLDGKYSSIQSVRFVFLMDLAYRVGLEVKVVGISFNKDPNPDSVTSLKSLPAGIILKSRDEISRERLRSLLSRPIELTADAAFLLNPVRDTEFTRNVSQWIGQQHFEGRVVVGINANSHLPNLVDALSLDTLVESYVLPMISIFRKRKNVSYLLIPHDFRGKESDVILAENILESLPPDIKAYSAIVPTPYRADEVKAICGDLDIVLSGRMHLAIACLGMGTPVGCITYQGKFEGLFKHFDLEGMTLPPEKLLQPGELERFLEMLLEKRESLVEHISGRIKSVQDLARKNL